MAKPAWVTVNPSSHTSTGDNPQNTGVGVNIAANGSTSDRSGTITVIGTVGNKTITRTISVSQQWAATLRIMWSYAQSEGIQNVKANVEDNMDIQASLTTAGTLKVGYPFLGGSNICHYTCTKNNGVFNFELNTVYIEASDSYTDIDADYWDLPNALFVPISSSTPYLYTPVIRFSYNPSTGVVSIVDTLYSFGGAAFVAEQGGGDYDDPICPDWDKMLRTGEVGNEENGYGAMAVNYVSRDEGGQVNITWPMFRWYPRIVKRTHGGITSIDVMIVGQGTGNSRVPDLYPNYQNLNIYNWQTVLEQQYYIGLFLQNDDIMIRDDIIPDTADDFYRKEIYVEISD